MDYITLDELKSYIGIPLTDVTNDTLYQEQITIASDLLDLRLGRFKNNRLSYHTEVYVLDTFSNRKMYIIPICPIQSITSMELMENNAVIGNYTGQVLTYDDYIRFESPVPTKRKYIKFTTQSGYRDETQVDPLVKEFIKKMVKYQLVQIEQGKKDIEDGGLVEKSFSIGRFSVTNDTKSTTNETIGNDIKGAGASVDYDAIARKYGRNFAMGCF